MSLSIDSLADSYLNQAQNTNSTANLENKLNKDMSNTTDEELMEVCKEFESYFTEQVFKAMMKMVPEEEETSASTSQLKNYYKESLISEYAKSSSEGQGLGIAKMMYEQMKRNLNNEIPKVNVADTTTTESTEVNASEENGKSGAAITAKDLNLK